MIMENKLFEVTVYSENQVGLLSTIANTFTRRSINIESLAVYPSEIKGIHKFTIKTRTTESEISIITKQIEKKVDVLKAFYYVDEENSDKELETVQNLIEQRLKNLTNK